MGLNGDSMGLNGDFMGFNSDLMGFNGGLMGLNGGFLVLATCLCIFLCGLAGRCYVHFKTSDKMRGLATCIPFGWTCNFRAGNLPGGAICIGVSMLYMLEAIYPLLLPSIHTWDLWAFIP